MNAEDWLAAFAEKLGTPPPAPAELEALLALAGTAAHASERTAAPVACWMAARAGVAPEDALALARKLEVAGADAGGVDAGGADAAGAAGAGVDAAGADAAGAAGADAP
ncbi:MAG TPA: hypothetical protein VG186_19335 [Solirubrobacteraceae bacterium]|nr:hypothetical protein [Solirubrobacteraceae bacterium]